MKKIQSKVKELDCSQHYTLVFQMPRAAYSVISGAILPKFKLIQAFMHVLVTCKNEEDPIKDEGARVFTRVFPLYVYGIFPDAQGHLTLQSMVEFGRISSETLWLFLLPAKMKNI